MQGKYQKLPSTGVWLKHFLKKDLWLCIYLRLTKETSTFGMDMDKQIAILYSSLDKWYGLLSFYISPIKILFDDFAT